MSEREDWREEQQRVDDIVSLIEKRLQELDQEARDKKEDVVRIRRNFWDDVTLNFDEPDEAVETYASMKQQAEVLAERERSFESAQKQVKTLRKLKDSPYFGRIDFKENGERQAERIYLGIASLLDEDEAEFLIYDWRAPISSLYYDYPPGPARYETPSGTIEGEMEQKRQYVIRDGRIRSMFDTGVTIGDELLREVLGKRANAQMKSIVATIQKEQNRIIRNEKSRLLIVRGAAGSGKTSAALQRVAYLLYRYRGVIRADHIVLFSPNPMFNSYVSTVLPELGEENMQQTTFQQYLEHRLDKRFVLENPYEQMEYIYTNQEDPDFLIRKQNIRFKASQAFVTLLCEYLKKLETEGMLFKNITFRGETLISARQIRKQFYAMDASISIPNRLELLVEWLLKKLKKKAREEQEKPWVEEEIQWLDKEAYLRAYKQLRRKKRFTDETFDDFDRERRVLSKMIVHERFKPLRSSVKKLAFVNVKAIYTRLFSDADFARHFSVPLPRDWPHICRQTKEKLSRGELAYEDATPFLFLKDMLEGFRIHTSVKHVFIDEAQDYTPLQFAYLKRMFPYSHFTVLGDPNQEIYAHAGSHDGFQPLAEWFDPEQTETIEFMRSYRSTKPIVEFTRAMVKDGKTIEPFNRDGRKPSLTLVNDRQRLREKVVKRIKDLQSRGFHTIAVIAKSKKECEQAYDDLRDHVELRLVANETATFKSGTVVIPSYLAKGIEFDAVVIYNAAKDAYGKENERKLFYTACTRAMHELHLFCMGEPSPFLAEVPDHTYEREPVVTGEQ